MYFGYCYRAGYINRYNCSFKWFAGVFGTLTVSNTIKILIECFGIRLPFYIPEQQSAGIKDIAQGMNIPFLNSFEIIIFQRPGNGQ